MYPSNFRYYDKYAVVEKAIANKKNKEMPWYKTREATGGAGALGGAAIGGMIGNAMGDGTGAAIGTALGGLAGGAAGYYGNPQIMELINKFQGQLGQNAPQQGHELPAHATKNNAYHGYNPYFDKRAFTLVEAGLVGSLMGGLGGASTAIYRNRKQGKDLFRGVGKAALMGAGLGTAGMMGGGALGYGLGASKNKLLSSIGRGVIGASMLAPAAIGVGAGYSTTPELPNLGPGAQHPNWRSMEDRNKGRQGHELPAHATKNNAYHGYNPYFDKRAINVRQLAAATAALAGTAYLGKYAYDKAKGFKNRMLPMLGPSSLLDKPASYNGYNPYFDKRAISLGALKPLATNIAVGTVGGGVFGGLGGAASTLNHPGDYLENIKRGIQAGAVVGGLHGLGRGLGPQFANPAWAIGGAAGSALSGMLVNPAVQDDFLRKGGIKRSSYNGYYPYFDKNAVNWAEMISKSKNLLGKGWEKTKQIKRSVQDTGKNYWDSVSGNKVARHAKETEKALSPWKEKAGLTDNRIAMITAGMTGDAAVVGKKGKNYLKDSVNRLKVLGDERSLITDNINRINETASRRLKPLQMQQRYARIGTGVAGASLVGGYGLGQLGGNNQNPNQYPDQYPKQATNYASHKGNYPYFDKRAIGTMTVTEAGAAILAHLKRNSAKYIAGGVSLPVLGAGGYWLANREIGTKAPKMNLNPPLVKATVVPPWYRTRAGLTALGSGVGATFGGVGGGITLGSIGTLTGGILGGLGGAVAGDALYPYLAP